MPPSRCGRWSMNGSKAWKSSRGNAHDTAQPDNAAGSSADFQSAVSPTSNRQISDSTHALEYAAGLQAGSPAIQQVGNLRYVLMKTLTHIDSRGEASMVDVSAKPIMFREAVARGEIRLQKPTLKL